MVVSLHLRSRPDLLAKHLHERSSERKINLVSSLGLMSHHRPNMLIERGNYFRE